jgi:hypothetical protein
MSSVTPSTDAHALLDKFATVDMDSRNAVAESRVLRGIKQGSMPTLLTVRPHFTTISLVWQCSCMVFQGGGSCMLSPSIYMRSRCLSYPSANKVL